MPGVLDTEGAGLHKVFIFLAGGVAFHEEREIALVPVPPAVGGRRGAFRLEFDQSGRELIGVVLLEHVQLFLSTLTLRLLIELVLDRDTCSTKLD